MVRRKIQRSAGLRLRVVAVAFACVLGQVSALAHRVLVQHVVCAEHGESVHVRASSSLDAAASRTDAATVVTQGPLVVATAPSTIGTDGHEHCSLAGTRSPIPLSQPDSVAGPEPFLADAGELHEAAPGPAVRQYLIAPKTSPPGLT